MRTPSCRTTNPQDIGYWISNIVEIQLKQEDLVDLNLKVLWTTTRIHVVSSWPLLTPKFGWCRPRPPTLGLPIVDRFCRGSGLGGVGADNDSYHKVCTCASFLYRKGRFSNFVEESIIGGCFKQHSNTHNPMGSRPIEAKIEIESPIISYWNIYIFFHEKIIKIAYLWTY